ncbi:hypothetical protein [Nonomuraea rubra]
MVRVRRGTPVVTDGPYLEAKEFLGGYYLVGMRQPGTRSGTGRAHP